MMSVEQRSVTLLLLHKHRLMRKQKRFLSISFLPDQVIVFLNCLEEKLFLLIYLSEVFLNFKMLITALPVIQMLLR